MKQKRWRGWEGDLKMTKEEMAVNIINSLKERKLPKFWELVELRRRKREKERQLTITEEIFFFVVVCGPFLFLMWWTWDLFLKEGQFTLTHCLLFAWCEFMLALIPVGVLLSIIRNRLKEKKLRKYEMQLEALMSYYENNPIDWNRVDTEKIKRVLNNKKIN